MRNRDAWAPLPRGACGRRIAWDDLWCMVCEGTASPLLLLDIDGTLCPVGPGPGCAMRHVWTGADAVWFRADLPDVLTELATDYELAWASAWQHHANLLLAPALGLPSLPVVSFADPPPGEVGPRYAGRTWKLGGVQRFAADRPLAWIDDDLHPDAYTWAAMRRIPTKLTTTDPVRGITDAHIRTLLAFARTVATRSRPAQRPRRGRAGKTQPPAAAPEPDHAPLERNSAPPT